MQPRRRLNPSLTMKINAALIIKISLSSTTIVLSSFAFHNGFDDVVQKAYRARVVLVSPSLLMLAIQVMQQILKDARMRDAADQIRTEVLNLGDDLGRLRERVLKLQKHFGDVNEDVRQILISADKIEKRAGRIEELDFSKETPVEPPRLVKGAELFPLPPRKLQAGE